MSAETQGAAVARAIQDLRWYALRLCVDNPERYEVRQTAGGVETKLSESVRVVLDRLAAVARERDEARRALEEVATHECAYSAVVKPTRNCIERGDPDLCTSCIARAALAARATPAGGTEP